MPPTSAIRKSSLLSTPTAGDSSQGSNTRRTTSSGRAIRTNTTRPANYYARTFAPQDGHVEDNAPPGFFPALTFFTDAITALPKEVMRQFTLMKEVEAKVHGPTERLGEVVDAVMQYPVPSRRDGGAAGQNGMLSFTAANSAMGSANVSVVNGVAPYNMNRQESATGSTTEESATQDGDDDLARRRRYLELRIITHNLLSNLDEKSVVLAEANRVLNQQLLRLDSVLPHVDAEIPEEARLGSMTHWAYSDNRIKTKPVPAAVNERNRRDVAATNSLAAAANAIHEGEIAAARREAGKEAAKEKHSKRVQREQLDSEFEERPKKTNAKVPKAKGAAALTGLGISTNGEPVKRRKLDKGFLPPAMERQISSTGKGKAAKETPRSTPAAEPVKKTKAKAAPLSSLPKRKGLTSAQASPALASSPLHSSFNPTNAMEPPMARPTASRKRTNSTTNLRQTYMADEEPVKATPVASRSNGEKSSSRKRLRQEPPEQDQPTDASQPSNPTDPTLKREDIDATKPSAPSRSNSSHKTSGRQSKNGTPSAADAVPSSEAAAMNRTRSTRSTRGVADTPSSEPTVSRKSHIRNAHGGSMSGLMRQIAPFNRSPDMNRGRDNDDMDDSLESHSDGEGRFAPRSGRRSGTGSRAVSRPTSSRKGCANADNAAVQGGDQDTDMPNTTHDLNIVSTREGMLGTGRREEESPTAQQPPALTHSPSPSLSSNPASPIPSPLPVRHLQQPPPRSPSSSPAPSPTPSRSPTPLRAPQPITRTHPAASPSPASSEEPENEQRENDASDEDDDPDPDDPSEPKYCYCARGSYGDMVGCDNPKCEREWFHLGCTDLEGIPGEEESWFCEVCRPSRAGRGAGKVGAGGGSVGGRGKGRGRGRGRGG